MDKALRNTFDDSAMMKIQRNIEALCKKVENISKVQSLTLDDEQKTAANDIIKGGVTTY